MTPRGASRRIEDTVVALSLMSTVTLMDYAKDVGQVLRLGPSYIWQGELGSYCKFNCRTSAGNAAKLI